MNESMTTGADEIHPFDGLGSLLKRTFQIYGKGFLKLIAIVAIAEAITLGAGWFWAMPVLTTIGTQPAVTVLVIIGAVLVAILSGILTVWMYGALIQTSSALYINKESTIGTAITSSGKRLLAMIGAGLVLFLILGGVYLILFLLMLIPIINIIAFLILIPVGIYFSVRLAFIVQIVFIEDVGPIKAISRSMELVNDNWWHTFGYLFVINLISGIISIALYFILIFIPYVGQVIAAIVVTPISLIGATLLYWDLRARNEHCSLTRIQAELDL